MIDNLLPNTPFRSRIRFTYLMIVISLLPILTACGEKTPEVTTKPSPESPEIVVTAWTAEVVGKLLNVDGCVRIRDEESDVDYALVWTPDISATIEGDEVRVISGIVRGKSSEVVLRFGNIVRVSGGETAHPDEELLQNLPANCQGPYWIVGFEIAPVQSTEEP